MYKNSTKPCIFLLPNNTFSALNPPQEAIVPHWIAICGRIICHTSTRHISPLPSLPHKKREIKLDPPLSAAEAFPLRCDSVTRWLSSRHSCPPSDHSSATHSVSPVLYHSPCLSWLGLLLSGLVSLLLWVVIDPAELEMMVHMLMTLGDAVLLHKVLVSGSSWELRVSMCRHV